MEDSTQDRSVTMEIAGEITLRNAPPKMRSAIKKALRIKNPTYEQAIRTNPKAKYTVKQFYEYYREDKRTGSLTIGRGTEDAVRTYARRSGLSIQTSDRRIGHPLVRPLVSTIEFRDYQRGIPDEVVSQDSGIVRLDTGFGKTIIGLGIIEQLQQRTIIIVPTKDLLNQWVHELKKWTNLESVGVVQGKKRVDAPVVVATIQSLGRALDAGDIRVEDYGCVLVDECHKFVTDQRRGILGRFPAKYRYGLTATARRSDGQGGALRWMFGDVLVDRKIERAAPTVYTLDFNDHIFVQEYHEMIAEQTQNERRNQMILDTIKENLECRKTEHRILVLTKRVKHYETLAQLTREAIGDDGIIEFSSSMPTEERDTLLRGLRDGSIPFKVMFGTMALLGTGIDVPSLSMLVIAGDLKSDVLVEQGAGRILRLFDGKEPPEIWDIVDTGNPILHRQGKLRQQFYKQQGWKISTPVLPLKHGARPNK